MTESILFYLVLRELFGIRINFMEKLLTGAKVHLDKQKATKVAQLLAVIIWVDSTKYIKKEQK